MLLLPNSAACLASVQSFITPFRTLAAAKAKYGAGLHNGKYEDPAVEYIQAYVCHRRGKAARESLRVVVVLPGVRVCTSGGDACVQG